MRAQTLFATTVIGSVVAGACRSAPDRVSESAGPPAGVVAAASGQGGAGREVVPPAANTDGLVRVLVFYDMEGVSGQDDWHTFLYGTPQYPRGRELLTADLNAVIDGLFAGGADSVEVLDQHGSTNAAEPDLLADRLDRRATVFFRDLPFDDADLAVPGRYDAVVGVAHHAKTGSGGFASHTITIGMDIAMNGATVTEVELMGYALGRVGAPLVMVTGDDKLQRDLAGLPWIQYVVTKRSRSADSVDLRPVDEVHAEMRAKAKTAIERLADAKAIRLVTPVTATLKAVPPADLSILRGVPGLDYRDNAVTFRADDYPAARAGLSSLIDVARLGWNGVMADGGGAPPPGGLERLVRRWLDVESGRWYPSPPSASALGPPRRYHGAP